MKRASIQFCEIEKPLPTLAQPFAALLDANDREWTDDATTVRLAQALLAAGCRYFVCFGATSASLHDRIDDVIVEHAYPGVVTTFHDDESKEDAVDYFNDIAIQNVRLGLVVVGDTARWKLLFRVRA